MKIIKITGVFLLMLFMFLACNQNTEQNKNNEDTAVAVQNYLNISSEEAKRIMDSDSDFVILDVRTEEEFAEGHIPGAILVPDYEIVEKVEAIVTDKNQTILVYCRSGRRSKLAAQELLKLGYTDIREFGGIIDWTYDIEK